MDYLGCKLNQAENEALARQLAGAGCRIVSSVEEADIYILNTCSVTHVADSKCRHLLRLAHRRNPTARLVAIGCYAEQSAPELAQIEGVSLVLGNEAKQDAVRHLTEAGYITEHGPNGHRCEGDRTRAFVKIQDGCQSFCTYCVVPLVRGTEKSLPADEIVDEIKARVADGYKEVVLTGTKVGTYNSEGTRLSGLLERILAETGVERLRLSSIQPQEINPELLELWQDGRLCPHFHLSLQSGSDSVLARMRRRYGTASYRQVVSQIREAVPDVAITTDVIVGFPGEIEAEFQDSFNFCREMGFARIHVFTYSPRRGTVAAQMSDQIPAKAKKERGQRMLALAKESLESYNRTFLGRIMPVLWENKAGSIWSGHTGNYIKVFTESERDLTNQIILTKLIRIRGEGVWGRAFLTKLLTTG